MNSLNIVFAGTPEFGVPCLEAIHRSSHRLSAVYTQPDRPAGRGRKMQASAVKEWATAHDVSVYQPPHFKDPHAIEQLASLQPDLMVVIAYGLILPQAVLDIPRLGCINVHASLLPRWRGASPIQHALLYGDVCSGVTIMRMDAGMDTGAMLHLIECVIDPLETAGSLHNKLSHLSVEPLLHTIQELAQGTAVAVAQEHQLATYAGKIHKDDALIRWQESAIHIDRMIRAFNPWPIACTSLQGELIRIHQAKITTLSSSAAPGTIVRLDKSGMLVATGEQGILVEVIQFPGGKAVSVADWLNAGKTQLSVGVVLQ